MHFQGKEEIKEQVTSCHIKEGLGRRDFKSAAYSAIGALGTSLSQIQHCR
jgi:hypothetical protein